MSCEQGTLNFPTRRIGSSLRSFDITIAEENGVALVSAQIIFKLAGTDTAALTLANGSGLTLTITTAGGWVITVDQIDTITLAAGVYYYQLKTTDAADAVEYYLGGTWEIIDT